MDSLSVQHKLCNHFFILFLPFYKGGTSKIGGWSRHMDVCPLSGCALLNALFGPPFSQYGRVTNSFELFFAT